jgi:hypothetical protein
VSASSSDGPARIVSGATSAANSPSIMALMQRRSAKTGVHGDHRAMLIDRETIGETTSFMNGDLQSGAAKSNLTKSTLLLGYCPAIAGPSPS